MIILPRIIYTLICNACGEEQTVRIEFPSDPGPGGLAAWEDKQLDRIMKYPCLNETCVRFATQPGA